jgi:drug/metabolite transporter (DMT)-like permease
VPHLPRRAPSSRSASAFAPRDAALLVLLSLLWGNSFLFVKIAVEEVPPGWVVAGRLTIGGALLLALLSARRQALPTDRRALLALAVIGVFGTAAGWYGQAWAQRSLDSGLVAVLNATTPVATLLLAVLAGIERLHPARVVGLAVAVCGSVVVIGGEVSAGGPLVALVVAATAPFAYALGSVITRKEVSGRVATLPAVAVQLGVAAAVMTALSLPLEGVPPAAADLSPGPAVALLCLGLLCTGTAFILYFTLIASVGATNASMVTYLVPIVGIASGAVVRDERFGANVFAGAALLVVGVYLAQREPGRPPTPATDQAPIAPVGEAAR